MQDCFPVVFYGHHACGSTWIASILEALARATGWRLATLADPLTPFKYGPLTDGTMHVEREMLAAYVQQEESHWIAHLSARNEDATTLSFLRGFHVIRDPRDLLVASYFFHRTGPVADTFPHVQEHRERLRAVSLEEGLFLEMGYAAQVFEDMLTWEDNREHILEVRLEELLSRPYEGFLKIFRFLQLLDESPTTTSGLTSTLQRYLRHHPLWGRVVPPLHRLPAEWLLGIVHRHSRPAELRLPGSWMQHFTEEHVAYFKTQYNDLLLKTGYERNPDWDRHHNRYTRAPSTPIYALRVLRSTN